MEELNLKNYAYIGDAVWEIFIRTKTIRMTDNAKKLHQLTTEKVKAEFQCNLLHTLEGLLTEEEHEWARRGRNLTIPIGRRQNQGEYRQATAFEVLIGIWYLNDKTRLNEILKIIEPQLIF